jgi:hypothetical protein
MKALSEREQKSIISASLPESIKPEVGDVPKRVRPNGVKKKSKLKKPDESGLFTFLPSVKMLPIKVLLTHDSVLIDLALAA